MGYGEFNKSPFALFVHLDFVEKLCIMTGKRCMSCVAHRKGAKYISRLLIH